MRIIKCEGRRYERGCKFSAYEEFDNGMRQWNVVYLPDRRMTAERQEFPKGDVQHGVVKYRDRRVTAERIPNLPAGPPDSCSRAA
jgi:hypothetical protein